MNVKLLSGALGAEISGIDLTDTSDQNFKKINQNLKLITYNFQINLRNN